MWRGWGSGGRRAYDRPGGQARSDDGMNGTERRYAAEVLEPRRMAGEILRWDFEPITFRLAPRTTYTPDFVVELAPRARIDEGSRARAYLDTVEHYVGLVGARILEVHEVKGVWQDAGRVKIKVAAAKFPAYRFVAVRRVDGLWQFEEIPPA